MKEEGEKRRQNWGGLVEDFGNRRFLIIFLINSITIQAIGILSFFLSVIFTRLSLEITKATLGKGKCL